MIGMPSAEICAEESAEEGVLSACLSLADADTGASKNVWRPSIWYTPTLPLHAVAGASKTTPGGILVQARPDTADAH